HHRAQLHTSLRCNSTRATLHIQQIIHPNELVINLQSPTLVAVVIPAHATSSSRRSVAHAHWANYLVS
ncbi:MAG: hypothetical protein ACREP9_01400, partial [Candidatus Dormibacteraceae bacterium]